jgi:hypothetical protein
MIFTGSFSECVAYRHGVLVQVWLDHVEAVVPDIGYHVHWHSLWQELVEGTC